MGGTCLNVGCIPSKALLESSELFHKANHDFKKHGITVNPKFDFGKMVSRKNKIVDETRTGVSFLMKKNKITVFNGLGSLENKNTVLVTQKDEEKISLSAKNIVIATGSKPNNLPSIELDKKRVITSTEALALKDCPKKLIVIGGGAIGLEMGSVFARLGSKIQLVGDDLFVTNTKRLHKGIIENIAT